MNHLHDVIKAGKPLSALAEVSLENKQAVNKLLMDMKRPITDFLFLPIYSVTDEMTAIANSKSGNFVKIIESSPQIMSPKK